MLFNLWTVCRHLLPHVGDFVGRQRLAIGQSHAHDEELVFAHRLDLLALLNHDIDVGRCDGRECAGWGSNPELIGSRCFDLKRTGRMSISTSNYPCFIGHHSHMRWSVHCLSYCRERENGQWLSLTRKFHIKIKCSVGGDIGGIAYRVKAHVMENGIQ